MGNIHLRPLNKKIQFLKAQETWFSVLTFLTIGCQPIATGAKTCTLITVPTFSEQDMLNSQSYNKNTAVQACGYDQAKPLQETEGKF